MPILTSLLLLLAAQPKAHRVVIGVTAPGRQIFDMVVGNVINLRKAFAPEPIEIEVVCYGSGIDMLLKSSPVGSQLRKLSGGGITFSACSNSLRGRNIPTTNLLEFAHVIPSGAAELVLKQEAGWSYLKGGY